MSIALMSSYVGTRCNWARYKLSQESVSSSRIWTRYDWLMQQPEVTKMRVCEALAKFFATKPPLIVDNENKKGGVMI